MHAGLNYVPNTPLKRSQSVVRCVEIVQVVSRVFERNVRSAYIPFLNRNRNSRKPVTNWSPELVESRFDLLFFFLLPNTYCSGMKFLSCG